MTDLMRSALFALGIDWNCKSADERNAMIEKPVLFDRWSSGMVPEPTFSRLNPPGKRISPFLKPFPVSSPFVHVQLNRHLFLSQP